MENLKIEYLPVESLKPYEKNARKHEETDVQTIVRSIEQFGFDDPIGVWGDESLIVEGHGRLLAAKQLGMDKVPCIRLDHLTDEQRRAYALAHNKTAEMSAWDWGLLDAELDGILDIDMSDFGFDLNDGDSENELVVEEERKGSLAARYLVPPFSVIYGNKPNWLDRKRAWVRFGIRSELGRFENLAYNTGELLADLPRRVTGGGKQVFRNGLIKKFAGDKR